MRKDSELFLKKLLEYRDKTGKDAFELNLIYFSEIPNVEVEIEDIFNELKMKKCISRKSVVLEQTIKIYLTLDGITYFDNEDKESTKGIIINISGKQINVATDNGKVDAKQYEKSIPKKNIPKTIVLEDNKNKNSTASSNSGDMIFWGGLIMVLVLTAVYSKYRFQTQLGLIIASIVTEVLTCLVYYNSKKSGVIYGKNIKEISYFNIGAILFVPILIGIVNSPIYTSKINLDLFKQSVDREGVVVAILNSEYSYYALFQMAGMFFIAMFLVHIICSDIYIIAISNIVAGRRGKWIWNGLFKLTYKRGKNWKSHIKVGIVFLIVSILFVAGIVPYIIDVINRLNASNFPIK